MEETPSSAPAGAEDDLLGGETPLSVTLTSKYFNANYSIKLERLKGLAHLDKTSAV